MIKDMLELVLLILIFAGILALTYFVTKKWQPLIRGWLSIKIWK